MIPKAWIPTLALLVAACGGAESTTSDVEVAQPSSLLTSLREVAQQLDRIAGKATGSADLEGLPAWVQLGPYKLGASDESSSDGDALREIISGDHPPQIRALAAMWLATAKQIGDLELFDALLDSQEPSGSFPSVRVTQQVQMSYPVTWQALTLGQVALDAAGFVIGRHFDNTADYRRWRAEQGDLESSVAYWEAVLKSETSSAGRAAKLAEIRERDPKLLAR
ncbi:MAG: hypothetical protein JRF63_14260, partial [Deltaproteobacteria bacterium]|nr:hypothetical protein [Deltaproteobacteria bacterium]